MLHNLALDVSLLFFTVVTKTGRTDRMLFKRVAFRERRALPELFENDHDERPAHAQEPRDPVELAMLWAKLLAR